MYGHRSAARVKPPCRRTLCAFEQPQRFCPSYGFIMRLKAFLNNIYFQECTKERFPGGKRQLSARGFRPWPEAKAASRGRFAALFLLFFSLACSPIFSLMQPKDQGLSEPLAGALGERRLVFRKRCPPPKCCKVVEQVARTRVRLWAFAAQVHARVCCCSGGLDEGIRCAKKHFKRPRKAPT